MEKRRQTTKGVSMTCKEKAGSAGRLFPIAVQRNKQAPCAGSHI